MNKILIFSIIMLCSLSEADGLMCLYCSNYEPGVGCLESRATCEGPYCKTTLIEKDGKKYHRTGCGKVPGGCILSADVCGAIETTTCCDDHDYCNDDTPNMLRCLVCRRLDPITFKCLKGKSTCIAAPGQKCKLESINPKDDEFFVKTGCSRSLDECTMSGYGLSQHVIARECCDNKNYCNGLIA